LVVALVKGLLGLTLSATMGGEKTRFFPFKPLGFLEGTSIGIGSAIGEFSLSGGCEGPPDSASLVL
jgi:hypothetical protein